MTVCVCVNVSVEVCQAEALCVQSCRSLSYPQPVHLQLVSVSFKLHLLDHCSYQVCLPPTSTFCPLSLSPLASYSLFPPQPPEGVGEHLNLGTSLFCSEPSLAPTSLRTNSQALPQPARPCTLCPFLSQPSPAPCSPWIPSSHLLFTHIRHLLPRACFGPLHWLFPHPPGSSLPSLRDFSPNCPLLQACLTTLSKIAAPPSLPLHCFVSLLALTSTYSFIRYFASLMSSLTGLSAPRGQGALPVTAVSAAGTH